jgi:hypothetical protein
MKRVILLLLPVIMLTSCEKQNLLPSGDIPPWLKEMIREAEAGESSPPMFASDMGAWVRYRYEGNYFFEWLNPIMSSLPPVYTREGLQVMDQSVYIPYQNGKRGKKYVWKGSSFPPEYDEW